MVAVKKHRTDTQPKERPKPKTYRKPGALSDSGDEPTEPTPTDIVGSVGSGGAGNDDTQNRQTPTHSLRSVGLSVGSSSDATSENPGATDKAKSQKQSPVGTQKHADQKKGAFLIRSGGAHTLCLCCTLNGSAFEPLIQPMTAINHTASGKTAHKTNVVRLDALKARLKAAGLTAEGASAQTQRTAIVRSIEGLCRKENVQFYGDFVWICGQPKPPAHKAHKGAQDKDVVRPVNRGAQAHTQTPPSKEGCVSVRLCSTPQDSESKAPPKKTGEPILGNYHRPTIPRKTLPTASNALPTCRCRASNVRLGASNQCQKHSNRRAVKWCVFGKATGRATEKR